MRILIEQIILPFYRESFFRALKENNSFRDLNILVGDSTTTSDTRLYKIESKAIHYSRTAIILGGMFYYVSGFIPRAIKADIIIVTFSLRNLNYYIALFLWIFMRKRVFLWGHVSGRNRHLKVFRKLGCRLGTGFIAYTKTDAKVISLPFLGFVTRTSYLGNSLYSVREALKIKQLWSTYNHFNKVDFIFSGRLILSKGVLEMLHAFIKAVSVSECTEMKLHIVGSGLLEAKMKSIVDFHELQDSVFFYNSLTEICDLSLIYNKSVFSLCCGYIGLNAIQSFMFGVPMVYKRDANHSPEIESCIEGFNCLSYSTFDDLVALFLSAKDKRQLLADRNEIHSQVLANYNTDLMALRMTKAIN